MSHKPLPALSNPEYHESVIALLNILNNREFRDNLEENEEIFKTLNEIPRDILENIFHYYRSDKEDGSDSTQNSPKNQSAGSEGLIPSFPSDGNHEHSIFAKYIYKIYFDHAHVQDMEEELMDILPKITPDSFFEIIYHALLMFCDEILNYFHQEIENFITESDENQIEYKPFIKNAQKYQDFISEMLDDYINIKRTGLEIEKILILYFEKCQKSNIVKIELNSIELHHQAFVRHILQDSNIQDYISTLTWFFNTKKFYAKKFPSIANKVFQLSSILKKPTIGAAVNGYPVIMNIVCNENPEDKLVYEETEKENKLTSSNSTQSKSRSARKDKKKKKKKGANSSSVCIQDSKSNDENLVVARGNENKKMEENSKKLKKRRNNTAEDEIEAFERRLEEVSCSSSQKVRLNITDEWVNKIKQMRMK